MSQILLCQGTALALPLADQCVHVLCTSPPYFGLRVYDGLAPSTWPGGSYAPVPGAPVLDVPAWEGCLGNEPTVPLFAWHTLLWLRECKRVLREDGVCWIILGDSYAAGLDGYPQGTLLGIPQHVMLAAIGDGWIVRNDCVWHKVAPMPESLRGWRFQQAACPCVQSVATYTQGHVRHYLSRTMRDNSRGLGGTPSHQAAPDCPTCQGTGRTDELVFRRGSWRHTRAHETVLMLTKQMGYWSDGEAVKEASSPTSHGGPWVNPGRKADAGGSTTNGQGATSLGKWTTADKAAGRNPRSVLTPAASPLALEYYASFPPGLIEPLLTATCPAQCCAVCGQGWAPTLQNTGAPDPSSNGSRFDHGKTAHHGHVQPGGRTLKRAQGGLHPTCACPTDRPPVPGVVLDPFAGASTTLLVARALGRHAIGVEASPVYTRLSRERLGLAALHAWEQGAPAPPTRVDDLPLFAQEAL